MPAAPSTPRRRPAAGADPAPRLLRALNRGDQAALTRLYEAWFDRAVAAAAAMTRRDEAFCLDVVQDAMLRLVRRPPRAACEAAFETWLMAALRSAAVDRIRSERRRLARELRAHEAAGSRDPAPSAPDGDDAARLRAALVLVREDELALIRARIADGRSLEQAGRSIGIGGDAAHGRLRRVLARLRDLLSEPDHDR